MIAVLGCGAWGRHLARNFAALGRLGAIVDLDEGALRTARTITNTATLTTSIDEALRAVRISGVAIATPAETHVELCHAALDRGLDVFCEKPLALDYAQAAQVARRAEHDGRVLMVGHILEYHPGVRALLGLVAEGALGEIRHIQTSRLHPRTGRHEASTLWALAPHDVAVILRLSGRTPTSVVADGTAEMHPGVAGVVALQLRFSGGVAAHVHLSSVHHFKEQRIIVVGSERTAVFDDVEDRLTLYDGSANTAAMRAGRFGDESRQVEFASTEPLRLECEAFLESMKTRKAPRADARSALDVLAVLEQAQESMRMRGAPVRFADLS